MSANSQSPITPDRIFQAANAFQLSHALISAWELNLFSALAAGHTDAKQLALHLRYTKSFRVFLSYSQHRGPIQSYNLTTARQ